VGRGRGRAPARAALVTGATSGIGEAFARALPATTGLLLTGRNSDALGALAAALSAPSRRRPVETIGADLAAQAGIGAVAAHAEAFGIDLLILNAGTGRFGDFLQVPEAALRETVAVNVLSPAVLARRLLPGMLERARRADRRAGLIVVASAAAFVPVPRPCATARSATATKRAASASP